MDVRWKDDNGSILNANKDKIIYFDASTNTKTTIKKEEIKKIIIEDGLMNIFKDFENDLVLIIVIPKKNKRDAVKIFNEHDKTGQLIKRNSGTFFLDLILDSSVITHNPFTGILLILGGGVVLFALIVALLSSILGEEAGLFVSRILIVGAIVYAILSRILLRIKRRRLKEID